MGGEEESKGSGSGGEVRSEDVRLFVFRVATRQAEIPCDGLAQAERNRREGKREAETRHRLNVEVEEMAKR